MVNTMVSITSGCSFNTIKFNKFNPTIDCSNVNDKNLIENGAHPFNSFNYGTVLNSLHIQDTRTSLYELWSSNKINSRINSEVALLNLQVYGISNYTINTLDGQTIIKSRDGLCIQGSGTDFTDQKTILKSMSNKSLIQIYGSDDSTDCEILNICGAFDDTGTDTIKEFNVYAVDSMFSGSTSFGSTQKIKMIPGSGESAMECFQVGGSHNTGRLILRGVGNTNLYELVVKADEFMYTSGTQHTIFHGDEENKISKIYCFNGSGTGQSSMQLSSLGDSALQVLDIISTKTVSGNEQKISLIGDDVNHVSKIEAHNKDADILANRNLVISGKDGAVLNSLKLDSTDTNITGDLNTDGFTCLGEATIPIKVKLLMSWIPATSEPGCMTLENSYTFSFAHGLDVEKIISVVLLMRDVPGGNTVLIPPNSLPSTYYTFTVTATNIILKAGADSYDNLNGLAYKAFVTYTN